ncbi:protein-disulfide reductase DsbD domain-containing protein [Chryseolinea sp. T2]|uniref:protein-disulfide reductase DsbD domain-containing protein n=1 Tax=Chryseolinea sp. T2 TaxID=3129255 RepID=UPI003076C852
MARHILLYIFLFTGLRVTAQESPVTWKFESKKTDSGTYELNLSATVSSPWHIYSQNTPEGGPIPTKIQFKPNPLVTMSGSIKEQGKLKTIHDSNFGVDVRYFSGDASFVQQVKLKSPVKTTLKGTIEYMVCNDSKCLPPVTVPFEITLN